MSLQATHDAAVTRRLEAIEAQLATAWHNRDCAGWGALLADDWSVTHVDRSYGDTAIVTGRTRAKADGEPPQAVTLRFTDVLVRRDDTWIVVASHATRLVN